MRVSTWCPDDLGRPGGVQAHALGLAGGLRGRSDAVTLFAPSTQYIDHEPPLPGMQPIGRAHRSRSPARWPHPPRSLHRRHPRPARPRPLRRPSRPRAVRLAHLLQCPAAGGGNAGGRGRHLPRLRPAQPSLCARPAAPRAPAARGCTSASRFLRSGHELSVLTAMHDVKQAQVKEAQAALDGLTKYQDVVTERQTYDQNLNRFSSEENEQEQLMGAALGLETVQAAVEIIAGGLHLIPDVKTGAITTMGTTYGGGHVAPALQAFGGSLGAIASTMSTGASLAGTKAARMRRNDDWDQQAKLAGLELKQVEKQILAAQIRLDIATTELANHELQMANAQEVNDFLTSKFTNEDLYDWMIDQLAGVHFPSYQMAYDLAKRAERVFRFELGDPSATFLEFGYWDSLHQGLLAGERLQGDLRRMEIAYLDQNRREYEITKHISLAEIDPYALVTLKETGVCYFTLPETLFDADYPGHYMRRIKTVGVSIPCVVGPYTSVNCTLTLLKNSVRQDPSAGDDYARKDLSVIGNALGATETATSGETPDPRFRDSVGAVQSIVTSTGVNDTGSFEQHLRDDRFLTFEGAGAISDWRAELPRDTNRFDFATITDLVLHVRYTARDGSELLKQAARNGLLASPSTRTAGLQTSGLHMLSAKHDFAAAWIQFLNPADPTTASLRLDLTSERFPFELRDQDVIITTVTLCLILDDGLADEAMTNIQTLGGIACVLKGPLPTSTADPGPIPRPGVFAVSTLTDQSGRVGRILVAAIDTGATDKNQGTWQLHVPRSVIPKDLQVADSSDPAAPIRFDDAKVRDLLVICTYEIAQ
jgi:hypothetical protein